MPTMQKKLFYLCDFAQKLSLSYF